MWQVLIRYAHNNLQNENNMKNPNMKRNNCEKQAQRMVKGVREKWRQQEEKRVSVCMRVSSITYGSS
jgi:hypothetical protein